MDSKPKRPRDPFHLAKQIGDIATGQAADPEASARAKASRLGGLKGGLARKKALTAQQRSEIARAAAAARWNKKHPPT